MLSVITDSKKIANLQNQFEQIMLPFFSEKIPVKISHKGKNIQTNARWSEDLKIWMCNRVAGKNVFWNAFGIERLKTGMKLTPACEINIPKKGIRKNPPNGIFLQGDESKNYYVGHRGIFKKDGGTIEEKILKIYCDREWITVKDDTINVEVLLIGELAHKNFPKELKDFVHQIHRSKNMRI